MQLFCNANKTFLCTKWGASFRSTRWPKTFSTKTQKLFKNSSEKYCKRSYFSRTSVVDTYEKLNSSILNKTPAKHWDIVRNRNSRLQPRSEPTTSCLLNGRAANCTTMTNILILNGVTTKWRFSRI